MAVGEMILDGPVEVCDTPKAEVVDPAQHEELAGEDIENDIPEAVCESPEVVSDTPEAEVIDEVQMVDGKSGYIELITVHVGAKGGAEFG
jgi:hypothetical protein